MARGAFQGIKAVELGGMVSGPYCGKLLADMGANVVKVEEPPDGDPARRRGPFPDDVSHPERSGLFLNLNTSKRGIAVDFEVPTGRDILARFAAWADVVIDNHAPGWLESVGLDWETLHRRHPKLVVTSITPYGRSGPRSGFKGTDLTSYHTGGVGTLLPPRSADISRAPVKAGGYPTGYHAGLTAALAIAAALLGCDNGDGSLIDVSEQESILSLIRGQLAGNVHQRVTYNRVPDRPPYFSRMECADGYVVLWIVEDAHWRSFVDLMGNPDWASGDEWNSFPYRMGHLFEIGEKMDEWAKTQKKEDFHHEGSARGFSVGSVYDAEEVLNYRQYLARDYFVDVDHPQAGKFRYAGWPYKMTASPPRVSLPAPLLGQHNDEVLRDVLGHSEAECAALRRSGAIWKDTSP
jgi:crotonobetainyl-CoA:carnitine CoA-transferase CaiB-like acyl-CoA transferase